jgi:hypothetical protein
MMATKVNDNLYTLTAPIGSPLLDDSPGECMASFDFSADLYQSFLDQLDPELSKQVKDALFCQPYTVHFHRATSPEVTIAAELGDQIHTNKNESYRPFVVEQFI